MDKGNNKTAFITAFVFATMIFLWLILMIV